MKKLINLISFSIIIQICILCFLGCSSENGSEATPNNIEESEKINEPPSGFGYTVTEIEHCSALLSWDDAVDPENELVEYSIILEEEVHSTGLQGNSITLENLSEETTYKGSIIATDENGSSTEVNFVFETPKAFDSFDSVIRFNESSTWPISGSALELTEDLGYLIFAEYYYNNVGYELLVSKLDNEGFTVWEKTFAHKNIGVSIVEKTNDGGFIVLVNLDMVKLDRNGEIQWTKQFTCPYSDCEFSKIKQTPSGEFVVLTRSMDLATYYKPAFSIMDENLEPIRSFQFDDSFKYTKAVDLLINTDGTFTLLANKSFTNMDSSDFWVANININGTLNWEKTYGDSRDEYGAGIIEVENKSMVLAGYTHGNSLGTSRRMIKITNEGDVIWNKSYEIHFGSYESLQTIIQTSDGGFVSSGFWANGNYNDMGIFKHDMQGNEEWFVNYSENFTDLFVQNIKQTVDGGFISLGVKRTNDFQTPVSLWLLKTGPDGKISNCVETELKVN